MNTRSMANPRILESIGELRQALAAQAENLAAQAENLRRQQERSDAHYQVLVQLMQQAGNQGNQVPNPQPAPIGPEQAGLPGGGGQVPPVPVGAQPAAPPVPPVVDPGFGMVIMAPLVEEAIYERFRKQKPPSFDGNPDLAEAESWIKRLQQMFHYMRLDDRARVACAVNQLEKQASSWWEVVVQAENVETLTWQRFVTLFHEKYLGEARLSGKVREFMDLRQGKSSVAEYTAKYDELARFAPSLVPTDQARKMKYMHGLRKDVVKQVDSGEVGPQTYSNAVQRALRIDGWDEEEPTPKLLLAAPAKTESEDTPSFRSQGNFKRKHQGNFKKGGRPNKNFGRNMNEDGVVERKQVRTRPQCPKCGKLHDGECRAVQNLCFKCGQQGHYIRDCPKWKEGAAAVNTRPKINARVYNILAADEEAGPSKTVNG